MKKEADIRGAELAPSSLTLGIESGRGVVSKSCSWENLSRDVSPALDVQVFSRPSPRQLSFEIVTAARLTYWAFRDAMFGSVWAQ